MPLRPQPPWGSAMILLRFRGPSSYSRTYPLHPRLPPSVASRKAFVHEVKRCAIIHKIEQFTGKCSDLAASEDKCGKDAEAPKRFEAFGVASPMQADAATRRRSKANRYRFALSALVSLSGESGKRLEVRVKEGRARTLRTTIAHTWRCVGCRSVSDTPFTSHL